MRNLGDGFDDEECPERESWRWEMRSTRAPGDFLFCFWRRGRSGLQVFSLFWGGRGEDEVRSTWAKGYLCFFLEVRSTRVLTDYTDCT